MWRDDGNGSFNVQPRAIFTLLAGINYMFTGAGGAANELSI